MLAELVTNGTIGNILGMGTGIGVIAGSLYGLFHQSEDKENKICTFKELKSLSGDGIMCSKNVRLSVKQSNEHVIMIAPSGAGKTRRFIMHNVNHLKNCSLIVTDPSGEIEQTCKTDKKKYILNPFSKNTVGYDPLFNCKNDFEVRNIAKVILKNGMVASDDNSGSQENWISMATPLLASYMLMNYHTKTYSFDKMIENICILPITSEVVKDKKGKIIKATKSIELEIMMSNVQCAIIEFKSFMQVIEARQTLSSIRTVMNSCLQLFLDDSLKDMLTKPSISMSDIRERECVVYIQIPEHHSDYFSPLIATFLTQMFNYLLENDGLQVFCMIDEFGSCGLIPSCCSILSTIRKHNVTIVAAIQSLTQLSSLYGELQGKQLKDLFKTILVCSGLKESAEYISNLLGGEEYIENKITQSRKLMSPSEVRMMSKKDMLIICDNKRPVIDTMMDIVA